NQQIRQNYHQIIQQYFEMPEKRFYFELKKKLNKFKEIIKKAKLNLEETKIIEKIVPRVIIIAGAIGSEKTTKAKHFEKYLKEEGYKVY
ncbi:10975_t:CDS:1, partial [Gigaspora margarita]